MIVNYVLKGGEQFDMVILVPDYIPEGGATTIEGSNLQRLGPKALFLAISFLPHHHRAIPRKKIGKLLALCESVYKQKLHPRRTPDLVPPLSTFTLHGDAAHATLPYLASGTGMSLEAAAILGDSANIFPTYPQNTTSR